MPEALGAFKLAPKAAAAKFLNSMQAAPRAPRDVSRALRVASELLVHRALKLNLRILKLLGAILPLSKLKGSHHGLNVLILVSFWPPLVSRGSSFFIILESLSLL